MPSTYDQYTASDKARQDFASGIGTQREAGVQKLKDEQDYAVKQKAVNDATKTLYETQKRLDNLNKNVQQRTAGRPITQAMLDRIVSAESQPLTDQYKNAALGREQAGQSLNLVEQAIRDWTDRFNQDSQLKYNDLTTRSQSLFDLWKDEQNKQFQREMSDREAQRQKEAQASDQAFQERLQGILANLRTTPTPTPTPPPTLNNRSTDDLTIEIPDQPGAGETAQDVWSGIQGIGNFWGNVGRKANASANNLNVGGMNLGALKSIYDDTLGRIFTNR